MRGQPLTCYEREKIELHLRSHDSIHAIAAMLCRDHSVIVRELQRNRCSDGIYRASKAQEYAEKRKKKKRKRKLETDEALKNYIVERIICQQWSPEQIAGVLKKRLEPKMIGKGISHETIYAFIYEGQGRYLGLYQHLRRGRKKRQRRYARKYRINKPISFITPIQFRPRDIEKKQTIGHWESDTTICESRRGALSVQKERRTQLARLTLVANKEAKSTEYALRHTIESLPPSTVRSITFDRGGEGGNHWKLRLDYGIDTYHCDPYSSWQKGGVENLNSLIRQYLPHGTNLSTYTPYDIHLIQEKLNNRPRKTLGFKTPNQCFEAYLQSGVVH